MGCEMRQWAVDTIRVERDASGAVSGLAVVDLDWSEGTPRRIASSERIVPAQLVLIACGFNGPAARLFETLDVKVTGPRNLPVTVGGASHRCIMLDANESASTAGAPVYVAGDARSGSSLVVSAIADALTCAAEVARDLRLGV